MSCYIWHKALNSHDPDPLHTVYWVASNYLDWHLAIELNTILDVRHQRSIRYKNTP